MVQLKLLYVIVLLNVAFLVHSASIGLELESVYADPVEIEEVDSVRFKRDAEPTRKGHLHHLLNHHHGGYRPTVEYQEVHRPVNHNTGGGATATFAQSSAGTINVNNGHGHGGIGSQASSQSASYSFGPFSASFSSSQANGHGSGGFFDY